MVGLAYSRAETILKENTKSLKKVLIILILLCMMLALIAG